MIKNFIDIENFRKKQLDEILQIAKKIKKNPKKFSSSLKNKTLGMIFEKQSLRTRLSFNVGMQKLGGNVVELISKDIGFDNKREEKKDILNILAQFIDCLMIRNNNHKLLIELSNQKVLPIINGLTEYSHPCQILGDFFTIHEIFKTYKKLQITWIGDYNNVLISPYFVMNLLWYPAYETLFSIIRKVLTKKSALSPDNLHLHQLVYLYLKDKISNKYHANSLSGVMINIYNLVIFYFASQDYSNTKYQLLLFSLSFIIYNFLYLTLKFNLKKSKLIN